MKCLRSGYCCFNYDIVIVDNPDLGPIENNLKYKPGGVKCQHLLGNKPGKYSCAVHDMPWYSETPCGQFGQIEHNAKDLCRMGEYILNGGVTR